MAEIIPHPYYDLGSKLTPERVENLINIGHPVVRVLAEDLVAHREKVARSVSVATAILDLLGDYYDVTEVVFGCINALTVICGYGEEVLAED